MATANQVVPAEEKALVPANVLEVIAAAASDPRVDPEKLEKLLALKERIDARDAEREFAQDFAAASAEMPRVAKNGVIDMGGKGKMNFARYEDIDKALRPIEAKHGFMRTFMTDPTPGGITMTVKLIHKGGHSEKSSRFMPPDAGAGRNAMQAIGSASSYAKRYLTLDIWNIICEGVDNDGSLAEPLNEDERNKVYDLLHALELNDKGMKAFLKFAGSDSVESIQRFKFDEIMVRLKEKLAEKERG